MDHFGKQIILSWKTIKARKTQEDTLPPLTQLDKKNLNGETPGGGELTVWIDVL